MIDTLSIASYEIERSTDNMLFAEIGTAASAASEWLDIKPLPGIYFYRIKCVNKGVVSYSKQKVVVLPDKADICFSQSC
ncbi:MAG: hypothetical protein IPP72_09775 [Chitinophagaceae bacterium]|nr:hypothetical protein [Chitinophagaceae bacterium]